MTTGKTIQSMIELRRDEARALAHRNRARRSARLSAHAETDAHLGKRRARSDAPYRPERQASLRKKQPVFCCRTADLRYCVRLFLGFMRVFFQLAVVTG